MKNKKILLVDDHPIFLKGLIEVLHDELSDFEVFAFKSSKDALVNFESIGPSVAILDLDIPEMNGIALSEAFKSINPDLKVIILTMHKEPDIIRSVIAKGIQGFVFKDDAVNELTKAIEHVLDGKIYLSNPKILNQNEEENELLAKLTKTELLVLQQITLNKTSKEIADFLSVSLKTIDNHRTNISRKLQLKGSNSLVKFAMSNKQFFI